MNYCVNCAHYETYMGDVFCKNTKVVGINEVTGTANIETCKYMRLTECKSGKFFEESENKIGDK